MMRVVYRYGIPREIKYYYYLKDLRHYRLRYYLYSSEIPNLSASG